MMLEHLDMAVAFAVVMLAVSLLVTILVQVVSALFGLRGSNLRWGIQQLLVTVDPSIGDTIENKEKQAGEIAQRVLTHPLISDSSVSRFKWLAQKVPVLGRLLNRMQLARAIRFDELVRVLNVVAPQSKLATDAAAAGASIAITGQPGAPPTSAEIERMLGVAETKPLKFAKEDLEAWFGTAMDRVSQRFAVHVRVWTVVFSIAIAFALHLDTFRILSQLAANPDLRAQVASASGALQQVASAKLNAAATQAANTPENVQAQHPPADPKAVHPPLLYRDAMTRVAGLKTRDVPGAFSDRQAAIDWLRTTMSNSDAKQDEIDAAVAAYQQDVDQNLTNEIDRLTDSALSVRGIVSGTGFQLVPSPYHSFDIAPWWPAPTRTRTILSNVMHPTNLHFWGILFSAGLLSLGAPFWYNALKSLSALKPVVANKEAQEHQVKG